MHILNFLPVLVTLSGIFFLFKLKFFFIRHPLRVMRKIRASLLEGSSFSSLSLALAGTLGIGNIIGVAVGLSIGGAGSVFWLFVSSLFAMTIKYCEASLSSLRGGGIGMIGVIGKSFGSFSAILSLVYASITILLSFFMGGMLQSVSMAQSIALTLKIPEISVSLLVSVMLIIIVAIGGEKIDKITSFIIPIATIVYIFLAVCAIFLNIDRLYSVINDILSSAFSAEGAIGGILGFLISVKIREGYMRGLLSNEAGAGTSSLAHAKNTSPDHSSVGVMGICEVFFDTTLLCTLTAVATLMSLPSLAGLSGVEIILYGIGSVFGGVSRLVMMGAIFVFAFSTVICWYYYGKCACGFVFGKNEKFFPPLFIFALISGSFFEAAYLISICDLLLFLASVISLSALMKNSDRIRRLSEKGGLI